MRVDILARAKEIFSATTVYGEAYECDGVTVVPAAVVYGGGGFGVGNPRLTEGGGFGMMSRPVGAFVIANGEVRWQPAVDVTHLLATLIIGCLLVARKRSKQRKKV